ncbi:MAG: hypothetical protein Q7R71_00050 [bacterium]|nr:hypothetical protein [bacterium]
MLDTRALADNLTRVIVNPLIALLFAAGLLVFVWGLVEFLWGQNAGGEAGKKEEGKKHMLWGLIGMFVMAAAYTLLAFIGNNICGSLSGCFSGT